MEDERKKFPTADITISGKVEHGYYDAKGAIFYITGADGEIIREVKVSPSKEIPVSKEAAAEQKEETEKKTKFKLPLPRKDTKKGEAKAASKIKPAYIYAGIGIVVACLLLFLGSFLFGRGIAAGSRLTQNQTPTQVVETNTNSAGMVSVIRAKENILAGEAITKDNTESYPVSVQDLADKSYIQYSRLNSFIEGGYVASSYIEGGRLIYQNNIQTGKYQTPNPWLGEDRAYFDIILTDSVLEAGGITYGKNLTLTVYPKDAPDMEDPIPSGITALSPEDPETKFTVNAVIADIYNEDGETAFSGLTMLSKIPEKEQRYYLESFLKENSGFLERLTPYSAKVSITKEQAAYLGDIARRGAITEMVITGSTDTSSDAKKSTADGIAVLTKNLNAVYEKLQVEETAPEVETETEVETNEE